MEATPPVNNTDEEKQGVKDNTAPKAVCPDWRLHLNNILPPKYRNELLQVLKLSVPVTISQVMGYMITTVSMVFCGHLGKTEFAGASLAIAVLNVTATCIGIGLALTCDTLVSQTFGSGNLKRVGVILQRGILILLLACFPCWAVLINTEPLLLAVKQSPEIASLSQLYVKIFMPALPALFMYQLQGKYLQNQGIVWPQAMTGAIGNILNAVINYIFVFPLNLGVAGSAAANTISQYVLAVVLFVYIYCRGLHKATWGGWSLDCLQEWGPFAKLAIPSLLMMCLKWWLLEAGVFLAGVISEVELGAHSIIYQLNMIAFMFPLGITAAAGLRVGSAVGSGNIAQAKLSCKVTIICAFLITAIVGTVFTLARHEIGYIFTKEQDILQRVSEVMITFVFMHVADGTAVVIGGILRGAGKLLVGALCNLVGYYFIGFPIGVSLMFAKKMGILGLWIGLTICAVLQLIFFIAYLCKLNWIKAAKEARVRAGVKVKENETEMESMATSSRQTQDQSSIAVPAGDDAGEDQDQRSIAIPAGGDDYAGEDQDQRSIAIPAGGGDDDAGEDQDQRSIAIPAAGGDDDAGEDQDQRSIALPAGGDDYAGEDQDQRSIAIPAGGGDDDDAGEDQDQSSIAIPAGGDDDAGEDQDQRSIAIPAGGDDYAGEDQDQRSIAIPAGGGDDDDAGEDQDQRSIAIPAGGDDDAGEDQDQRSIAIPAAGGDDDAGEDQDQRSIAIPAGGDDDAGEDQDQRRIAIPAGGDDDAGEDQDQRSIAIPAGGGDDDDAGEDQAQPEGHMPDQNPSTTTTVGVVLSVKQLVLRRGLALLLMVVLLVAGIVLSDFLTHLLK